MKINKPCDIKNYKYTSLIKINNYLLLNLQKKKNNFKF